MHFTSWNLKTIVLAFAAIGAVIAAAVAFSIPNQYRSMSLLRTTARGDSQIDVLAYLNRMEQGVLSRASLEGLIIGLDLYKSQRRRKPMEDIVQDMRSHDIVIKLLRKPGAEQGTAAFAVSYNYPDPKLAQAVTQGLVTKFIDQNLMSHGGPLPNVNTLEVLDPANQPVQPIYPRIVQFLFTGICAGLLAGLAVSYALRWRISIVRRPAQ
jgi:uncharacterized protein involved in exopolysaccharide biosynthesis